MSHRDATIKSNVAFAYGRNKNNDLFDLDKRIYVKTTTKLKRQQITSFENEFEFLLPEYKCNVSLSIQDDIEILYPSYEHALIASKLSLQVHSDFKSLRDHVKKIESIREAKQFVNKYLNEMLSKKWKEDCIKIAEKILRDKFLRNHLLKDKLLDTQDKELIFNNDRGETFWGVSKGKGENHLGQLLEKIRTEFQHHQAIFQWMKSSFDLQSIHSTSISILVEEKGQLLENHSKILENCSYVSIGKHNNNSIIVSNESISDHHAVVLVDKSLGFIVLDLNSCSKTVVDSINIKPFYPISISTKSIIMFGSICRIYRFAVDTNIADLAIDEFDRSSNSLDNIVDPTSHEINSNENLTVFVGGIPFESTEKQVLSIFSSCGEISKFIMPVDIYSKQIKGHALITYKNFQGFTKALFQDGIEFNGRTLRVKKSESNHSRENGNSVSSKPSNANDESYYQSKETRDTKRNVRSNSRNRFAVDSDRNLDIKRSRY